MKIKRASWSALVVAGAFIASLLMSCPYVDEAQAAQTHHEKADARTGDHDDHSHDAPKASSKTKAALAKEKADPHAGHSHGEPQTSGKPKDDHLPGKVGGQEAHDHEKEGTHEGDEHHEGEQVIRLGEKEMKQHGIEVSTASSGQLQSEISLPGEVILNEDNKAHIVPRVAGVVKEVKKTLGDTVRKGEIMAVIESRELADAKADYLAAQEKTILAQSKFTREERLWKKKISAEQEYLEARQGFAEARIALRSAEQKLHALGLTHEQLIHLPKESDLYFTRFEITAPFNATVIEKHIALGEMLKDDADIFLIADLSTVWVNLNIYQKDVPKVRKGQRVLISLGQEGGEQAEGRIAYVQPVVKEETRTAVARVVLPNPEGNWRPGMFVTASVMTESGSAPIVVPQSALQTIENQSVVFVQTHEGFELRPVKTGRKTNGNVEITSGLSPGERYASKGTFTLKAQLSKGAFGDGHAH